MYLAKSIKAFPDQQGLANLMKQAGFAEVTWKNYTGGISPRFTWPSNPRASGSEGEWQ
ncbi:class I SAM-dependent methyltransferase [Ellagibacter isourolithinifaciens]|uniref:class I SAM-dependent methyltransferase n=1 Tax=Ellagibacter isourolithinifaciens TaxID=2137581 RepID=UPI003A95AD10